MPNSECICITDILIIHFQHIIAVLEALFCKFYNVFLQFENKLGKLRHCHFRHRLCIAYLYAIKKSGEFFAYSPD